MSKFSKGNSSEKNDRICSQVNPVIHPVDRRDSSSGRASASCAVGQDGCRIDTWPRHTKDVIKMVPVAALLGAQHYKASTGFSSLTNHASLTSHNEQKKKKKKKKIKKPDNNQCLY